MSTPSTANIWKLELVWWAFSAALLFIVTYPILSSGAPYPFWKENVGFILVFVTALRYIFLLQFTPIAYVQWAKVVVFVASIPGLLLGIGWMHEFQLYLEEGEILTLFPASLDGSAAGDRLIGYVRVEMLFFGTGALFAMAVLPVRMLVSFWRTHNRGTV